MLNIVILCAHLQGGWGCLPLNTMADCLAAQRALPTQIVNRSECEPVELFVRGSPFAPEMAPMPEPKYGEKV